MNQVLARIERIGIVPVIVLNDPQEARPMAAALCDGGLPCAEITFRTDAAEEAIRIMSTEFPDMLIGAGTVLTTEQVDRAVAAGASFIVSPGTNRKVIRHCIDKGVAITPGISCPTDIETALEFGLEVLKFFPAEASGGLAALKAMSAPYPRIRFMPTGGINEKNIVTYLNSEKIIACGGSWMVNSKLVEAGAYDKIRELTNQAMLTMLGFELMHVGINCDNAETADGIAAAFGKMFGFPKQQGSRSFFAGTAVEAMKEPYRGANGHIAMGTNSVLRAVNYLAGQGFGVDMETAGYKGNKLNSVYLNDEAGGFAIHLLQKPEVSE